MTNEWYKKFNGKHLFVIKWNCGKNHRANQNMIIELCYSIKTKILKEEHHVILQSLV